MAVVEFGIKKKRAAQAALTTEILLHVEHGAVRALSLEQVTNLSDQKETRVRAQILGNGEEALLALSDLKVLSKGQWKAVKGKEGSEANSALAAYLAAQAAVVRFSDLPVLYPFKIDDSGDEFIKVGNTSAIRVPIIKVPSLQVALDYPGPKKCRFSKSQRVTQITL